MSISVSVVGECRLSKSHHLVTLIELSGTTDYTVKCANHKYIAELFLHIFVTVIRDKLQFLSNVKNVYLEMSLLVSGLKGV